METIPKSECTEIGFFRKTHGIHGALTLEFLPQYEFSVEDATRFFVELDGLLVPFFVSEEGIRFKGANSAIVSFENVTTEKYAKRIVGCAAYLFQEEIVDEPEESPDSEFKDLMVWDKDKGEIGRIERVDDFSGNLVLTVIYRGKELMIPYNEELLVDMDEAEKKITLQLPDGLID